MELKVQVRPFAWHDIWLLYRYRTQVQFFDSALVLTGGNPVGVSAMFGHLYPVNSIYTGVLRARDEGFSIVGQVHYRPGEHSARLAFMLPERSLGSPTSVKLIESLAWEAGDRGAFHILAEVDERSQAVDALRRAGFSVFGWQRVWRFSEDRLPNDCEDQCWCPISGRDEIAVRSLYHTLVPPLVQGAEPLNGRTLHGLVYHQGEDVLAYAEGQFGPRGIYLNPVVHPDVTDVTHLMYALLHSLSPRGNRPVYVAVRSYQTWIESALEELGGEPGPRQALMIKHMVNIQRAGVPAAARQPVLENRQPVMAGNKAESYNLITKE